MCPEIQTKVRIMSNEIQAIISGALPVVELSPAARKFISASIRPNTARAYRAQLKKWHDWVKENNLAPFPANPEIVANYLAHLAENGGRDGMGAKVSTLRTAIAALKFGHDVQNMRFESTAPEITKVLRGIRNERPQLQRQAEPIRGIEALQLIQTAGPLNADKRDAAVIALGYIFALRRSEIVGLDNRRLGDGLGFINITGATIELTLARSKTSADLAEVVTVPRAQNADAVTAIEQWIEAAGIQDGEPLIRRVNKADNIGARLSEQSVNAIVKRRIVEYHMQNGASRELAEQEAERISGHSLRVGFATTAAESGADIRAIASVTRHKSLEMPRRYAQRADQIKTSPHNMPGVGLSQVSL